MSRTDDLLAQAERQMSGVRGGLALVRESRRELKKQTVIAWIQRLRAAADTLEEMISWR